MWQRTLGIIVPAILVGGLLTGPPATAKETAPTIQDDARLFSKRAREEANTIMAEIKRLYKKDLLIETVAKAPEDIKKLKTAAERRKFFVNLARKHAKNAKVNGVYVLITKSPGYVVPVAGQQTQKKAFTTANLLKLGNDFYKALKEAKGDENKRDEALLTAVKYVRDTMKSNLGK
jgi:hypothetical protein